jgi:hypothetical protein
VHWLLFGAQSHVTVYRSSEFWNCHGKKLRSNRFTVGVEDVSIVKEKPAQDVSIAQRK